MCEETKFEEVECVARDDIPLQLRYCPADSGAKNKARKTVLLLHGASANHASFTTPNGRGLATWLVNNNFDTWLLDWRGSSRVVDESRKLLASRPFNFNAAAECDLPAALAAMHLYGVREPIAALGHCMGGGVLAESIARGGAHAGHLKIDRVVLLTLGLFYETPIDG